jgi:hypothetical protein
MEQVAITRAGLKAAQVKEAKVPDRNNAASKRGSKEGGRKT